MNQKGTFAVKLINKELATSRGYIKSSIIKEVRLHRHCSSHVNVIKCFGNGENQDYYWIALELAQGGDLFDKIEPDQGVEEDIAHLYFRQLINGVGFLHSKGVAHRDIKPENIFLDNNGNLKIGDFGLATLFRDPSSGTKRPCSTACGSPPYIAPEVVSGKSYVADKSDLWSSGVVLFVLLCGITPWNEPLMDDYDFRQYHQSAGKAVNEYWNKIPIGALSLLRGMMKLDPDSRFKIDDIIRHPWFTRSNRLLTSDGYGCNDPVDLATRLLTRLRIDVISPTQDRFLSTQPVNLKASEMMFTQPLYHQTTIFSQQLDKSRFFANSQQLHTHKNNDNDFEDLALGVISMDPMQCQYSQLTNIPESMSQRARKFNDLIPAGSRSTRFYSKVAMESLVPLLNATLNRLSVQVPSVIDPMIAAVRQQLEVPIVAPDRRRLSISGKIKISKLSSSFIEVDFVRLKGDPLEWRYLFKKVVLQCREAVYIMNSN